MSLFISPRPSQGAARLRFSTLFLEASTVIDLQAIVDLITDDLITNFSPAGEKFISDIQYRTVNAGGNMINYSVMIVIGEWNPS